MILRIITRELDTNYYSKKSLFICLKTWHLSLNKVLLLPKHTHNSACEPLSPVSTRFARLPSTPTTSIQLHSFEKVSPVSIIQAVITFVNLT